MFIEKEDKYNEKISNMKSLIDYLRSRKKGLKLEVNNLVVENEENKQKMIELEQININLSNKISEINKELAESKDLYMSN